MLKRKNVSLLAMSVGIAAISGASVAEAATVSFTKQFNGVDFAVSATGYTYTGNSTTRELKIYTPGNSTYSRSENGSTVGSGKASLTISVIFNKTGSTWSAVSGSVLLTDTQNSSLKLANSTVFNGVNIGANSIAFAFTQSAGFAIPAGLLVIPSLPISGFNPSGPLVTSVLAVSPVNVSQGVNAVPLPAAAMGIGALLGNVALRRRR